MAVIYMLVWQVLPIEIRACAFEVLLLTQQQCLIDSVARQSMMNRLEMTCCVIPGICDNMTYIFTHSYSSSHGFQVLCISLPQVEVCNQTLAVNYSIIRSKHTGARKTEEKKALIQVECKHLGTASMQQDGCFWDYVINNTELQRVSIQATILQL